MLPESPDRVARDIYPLPLLPVRSAHSDGVCRATGRRALRGRRLDQDAQFCARGLSSCYLGTELSSFSLSSVEMQHDSQRMYPTSAAQFQVISRIRSSVRALGSPPEGMTPAGALNELRGSVSGYSDAPKGTRPFAINPVSCPFLPALVLLYRWLRYGTMGSLTAPDRISLIALVSIKSFLVMKQSND